MPRIYVTGAGIISGMGLNVSENLKSVYSGKSGIGRISILKTIHTEIPASEVKFTDVELMGIAGIKDGTGWTRTSLLAVIAAKEAFLSAGNKNADDITTGLVSATTTGGMDKTELYFRDYLSNDSKNEYIESHDCGDSTERIAEYLGIKGFMTTVNTACSSSSNAIIFGARLIKNGICDRVIAGGVDALCKFTINGFNTLMILDKDMCKPFDANRKGLNLGEGAGYVVLESEEAVKKSGSQILCELKGYANANDAFHQTASSPEGYGAMLAMTKAFEMSGLHPEEIDYINAHGTGTENNDLAEGFALEKVFGNKLPPVSSTKPFTGHTLGASGGIEAVFSILAIKEGILYPNLNFSDKIPELSFKPQTELKTGLNIRNVLSNSFGFGGNNTTLIFSKV